MSKEDQGKTSDHFYPCFRPQGIANKYPDFKSDHAFALLLMRGDVTRAEARQVSIWSFRTQN